MTAQSRIEVKTKPPGLFATGVALFSMFFGAGNLIFPLLVGKAAGTQCSAALTGLMISAILFPLLGLLAMTFFDGNIDKFLQRLGKGPAFFLLFSLQIAQGPICLSRLFNLMHASIKSYLPIPLFVFSIVMALIVFFIAFRSHRLIAILGKILTPFLLISITVLIVGGILSAPTLQTPKEGSTFFFLEGLKGGYMTMDLIAALLFSTVIIPIFSKGIFYATEQERKNETRRKMLGASCIAAILLLFAYVGLGFLAAHHGGTMQVAPEELLQALAVKVLGKQGAFVAAVAVFLACLTTAVALAAVFANYLRKDLLKEKISPLLSLSLTVAVAACITNLGFARVLQWTGPAMEILYPALIVLCLCNIAHRLYDVKWVKTPVFAALAFGAIHFFTS